MIDDTSDIVKYYSEYDELGRLERQQIERDVTRWYLEKYLPPTGRILEIGAGPGAYTIPLAKKGYRMTAVDFTPGLVEICRQRVSEHKLDKLVRCFVADARDLSSIEDTGYDAVLLMGPLYHLVHEADRQAALREAYDRLKPGGRIFSAFISRFGIWAAIINKDPDYIEYIKDVNSVLETGCDPVPPTHPSDFRAYFTTAPEIAPLHEQAGFRTLVLAGVEPGGIPSQTYKTLPEHQRKLWLDLMVRISTEPSVIGASCHILYAGEKPG